MTVFYIGEIYKLHDWNVKLTWAKLTLESSCTSLVPGSNVIRPTEDKVRSGTDLALSYCLQWESLIYHITSWDPSGAEISANPGCSLHYLWPMWVINLRLWYLWNRNKGAPLFPSIQWRQCMQHLTRQITDKKSPWADTLRERDSLMALIYIHYFREADLCSWVNSLE